MLRTDLARDALFQSRHRVGWARTSRSGARAVGAESPWGGYTFNPGLRRTRDIRALGSFAALGHEGEASAWFKARGMRLAALEQPACETTGQLRHVRNERAPSTSRGRLWRT
jgi:hypothetical protein